jgi:hypothetical protein
MKLAEKWKFRFFEESTRILARQIREVSNPFKKSEVTQKCFERGFVFQRRGDMSITAFLSVNSKAHPGCL